jgi:exosortase
MGVVEYSHLVNPGQGLADATLVRQRKRTVSPFPHQSSARIWIALAILFGGTLAVFWPILPELWTIWWEDSNNSHGLLVPLMVAYLVWIKRERLRDLPIRPSLWGLGLLVFALLLYLFGLRVNLALPARVAMVLSVSGLVWWNFGTAVARCLLFPLAFLGLMIPVPDSLTGLFTFPLQLFASSVSASLIAVLGIPVLQEGTMLYFANASLEVAEACSGIRSMVSYLTLGLLFTHLGGDRMGWVRKIILLMSTIPLALIINIVRLAGTGILAAYFGSRAARGFLHEFSGFVVFGLGFLILAGGSILLQMKATKIPETSPPSPQGRAVPQETG